MDPFKSQPASASFDGTLCNDGLNYLGILAGVLSCFFCSVLCESWLKTIEICVCIYV